MLIEAADIGELKSRLHSISEAQLLVMQQTAVAAYRALSYGEVEGQCNAFDLILAELESRFGET